MAKLVRRHTSNVEIIGSNPIGSNFFLRQVPPCNECTNSLFKKIIVSFMFCLEKHIVRIFLKNFEIICKLCKKIKEPL